MALSGNSSPQSPHGGVAASAPEAVVSGVTGPDLLLRRMRGDDVALGPQMDLGVDDAHGLAFRVFSAKSEIVLACSPD